MTPFPPEPRRDILPGAPAFRIDARGRDILASVHESHHACVLADLHRQHCWAHRPVVGISGALDGRGFREAWESHRAQHMAEAWAEYHRAFRTAGQEQAA